MLSVGRDRGRDWKTLVRRSTARPCPVDSSARPSAVDGLRSRRTSSSSARSTTSNRGGPLGGASVVALALDPDVAYPPGQTDAQRDGGRTPVVLTDSPAMRDYARTTRTPGGPPGTGRVRTGSRPCSPTSARRAAARTPADVPSASTRRQWASVEPYPADVGLRSCWRRATADSRRGRRL